MLLLAYVDDLVLAAKSTKDIKHVFDQLATKWRITSLGVKIERDRSRKVIHLSQPAYIDKLAERFPGYSLRVAKIAPIPVTRDRGEQGEDEGVSIKVYQEIAGSLLWAASCTRPDTAFAASFLARSTAEPKQSDMDLALRIVSYLVQTRTHGIELGGAKTKSLETYIDSAWGGCKETRRSTTGYVSFFLGSPINWTSKRQATVSSSSMEAEYVAAAEATKDVIWLRSLLEELGLKQTKATTLYIDNKSAIHLSANPSTHVRSKHIDIWHHLVREQVGLGTINVN